MMASVNKAELFADLRRMINNPDYCDGCFNCKDGKDIHACWMLLRTRCAEIESHCGPANHLGKRRLDITSSAFLSILEYIYTGDMVQYSPFSSIKAGEVIQASKVLKLPNAEKIVKELTMRVSESDVDEDLADVALKLSVALDSDTHANASNANPATLVRILSAADLKPVHLRDLSETALEYYLTQTQSTTDPEIPSLREFVRFQQVILWCVTQICPDEAAEVVTKALRVAKAVRESETDCRKILKSLLTNHAATDRLLGQLDYRRIHFKCLKNVVMPLEVVPQYKLAEAYLFHAEKNHKPSLCTWEYGSSYSIGKNKSVIAKSELDVGFARFSVPIFSDHGVYEWAIVVEEWCCGFCEIGIYSVDGLQESRFTGSTLAEQPSGRALRHDLDPEGKFRTRINQREGPGGWVPFRHLETGFKPRVKVKLDMDRRVCDLAVNDHEYSEAWMDLPFSTVYYPAVSLGDQPAGRVRIELISGFDMV